jgi:hypothetical protein
MTRAKKKNIWKEIETVRNLIKRHVALVMHVPVQGNKST